MDSKKVIETLIKIAEKQQKIIEKLAQQAQSLPEPPHPELHPGQVVMNALPVNVKPQIKSIMPKGDTLEVSFAGAPNQGALDAVTQTVQKLLNARPPLLPFAYKVKAIA